MTTYGAGDAHGIGLCLGHLFQQQKAGTGGEEGLDP